MALIVQKFGGTSVANIEGIQNAARRVAFEVNRGHQVVAVVSAMAGMTNQLITYVNTTTSMPRPEEYDVVVSAGEQITSGLLALALQNFDIAACSLQSWQIPIQTDSIHTKARLKKVSDSIIKEYLNQNVVPIISGFQGISPYSRITTFGRGGSDITAVALAAILKADRCDLYKDVSGIYTADPHIVPHARKLEQISYKEMLELASLGSKVIQHRAVALAMSYNIPLRIFSSFEESSGTEIMDKEKILENYLIYGITCNNDDVHITVSDVFSKNDQISLILSSLTHHNISIDMISYGNPSLESSSLTFTISQHDFRQCEEILKTLKISNQINNFKINQEISKISIVGISLRSYPQVMSILFETLAQRGIYIFGISSSETRISILISQDFSELALRFLHVAYKLEKV